MSVHKGTRCRRIHSPHREWSSGGTKLENNLTLRPDHFSTPADSILKRCSENFTPKELQYMYRLLKPSMGLELFLHLHRIALDLVC